MEEAGDLVGEAAVHVVDEGIEDAGRGAMGDDIVVGDGGGDQGAVTFPQQDIVGGAADVDGAVALDTHRDDEAVVFAEVAVEGF